MDKQKRIDEIDRKCRSAGCSDESAKKHLQMYVYENWDPHPPDEFKAWHAKNGEGKNAVSAWNCGVERQAFYRHGGCEEGMCGV